MLLLTQSMIASLLSLSLAVFGERAAGPTISESATKNSTGNNCV
jgi:hypothetical protein